ncbi:MAG: PaaI family thioesterase [Anaerolineales bacterium]
MTNKQANSLMCFTCGLDNPFGLQLHFYDNGSDEVWADFVIGPNHQGYPGMVHGGVVAAILDEVGSRVMMAGRPNRFGMTAKMEVRYRQPVPLETPLRAVACAVKDRGRFVTAHAEIRTQTGDVLAEAEVLMAEISLDRLPTEEADRLGWRVYPAAAPA